MSRDTRVILQPAGGPEARSHYIKTVHNSVMLSTLADLLSAGAQNQLRTHYPSGRCRVWGVTPGANGINVGKWEQFAAGDRVLFCRENRVFASTTLRMKLHNRELAMHLWKRQADGQTWEYIYFVGGIRDQGIPIKKISAIVGYRPGY